MSWSLGETQALAIKACRGAGYPWGLAEEGGYAVRWLSAHGLPGLGALAALLQAVDVAGFLALKDCPIAMGAALSDSADPLSAPKLLGTVRVPLLLVPFVTRLRSIEPVSVEWDGVSIGFETGRLFVSDTKASLLVHRADCTLRPGKLANSTLSQPMTRVPDRSVPQVSVLDAFAARTYAPATEESRFAGAGTGTGSSDND